MVYRHLGGSSWSNSGDPTGGCSPVNRVVDTNLPVGDGILTLGSLPPSLANGASGGWVPDQQRAGHQKPSEEGLIGFLNQLQPCRPRILPEQDVARLVATSTMWKSGTTALKVPRLGRQ